LHELYASDLLIDEMRLNKQTLLESLQADLNLPTTPNKASLSGARTYDSGMDVFSQLFEASGRAWPTFISELAKVTPDNFDRDQQSDFATHISELRTAQ
jgi:hypothetical protein